MKNLFTPLFLIISCTLFSIHAKATVVMIEVKNYEFEPDEDVNVNVGDTIQWFWTEGFHTTTSTNIPLEAAPWDAEISSSSTTFEYVVNFPGSYDYVCTPHAPGMAGHFTATGGTNVSAPASEGGWDFQCYVSGNELLLTSSFPISGVVEARLLDIDGKLLKQVTRAAASQTNFSFGISNVPKGIYLVEIASELGRITRKVAIQ